MNSTSAYVGEKRGQVRHGIGHYKFKNSFFEYEGGWENGKMEGQGRLLFADGGYYEGEFSDGEMEGQGLRVWADGSSYSGQFRKGERYGIGRFESKIGKKAGIFEGQWKGNKMNGKGTYDDLASGDHYEGEFVDHMYHGDGRLEDGKGGVYEGEWRSGKKHGEGSQVYGTRDSYVGSWENGLRSGGEGRFYHASSGYRFHGFWKDSVPTQLAFCLELDNIDQLDLSDSRSASPGAGKVGKQKERVSKKGKEEDLQGGEDLTEEELVRQRRRSPVLKLPPTKVCPQLIISVVDEHGIKVACESGRTFRLSLFSVTEKKEKKSKDDEGLQEELRSVNFSSECQGEESSFEEKPFGSASDEANAYGGVPDFSCSLKQKDLSNNDSQPTARKSAKKGKDSASKSSVVSNREPERDSWKWKSGGRVVSRGLPFRKYIFETEESGNVVFSHLVFENELSPGIYKLVVEDISGPWEDELSCFASRVRPLVIALAVS
uniref:Uncharacterized protein n=1 Tax=Palpitomonas bilix TaxID=652834 RepID=A0A7S3D7Y8_9EUKA|mmetsp:Transcript_262/g.336  ORF Transcript_262/g.336 Transcript_262/m.336 type:complete len:489 (+) Transcript_262:173-1639(+)